MKHLHLVITIILIAFTIFLCVTNSPTAYLTPVFISMWIAHLHAYRHDKRKDLPPLAIEQPVVDTSYLTDISNLMTKVNELQTTVEISRIKR